MSSPDLPGHYNCQAPFPSIHSSRQRKMWQARIVFIIGMLMWPLAFGVIWSRHWGPFEDYFGWGAGLVGMACCGGAPFLTPYRLGQQMSLLVVALIAYAVDFPISFILSIAVFGLPNI